MPRNDRTASIRIAEPQMNVPCTMSGATVFGSTCRTSSVGVGVPTVMAASTYGSSRMESTMDRTRRTTRGMSGMTIAMTTASSPARDNDTTPMASRIAGIAISPSMMRMMMPSSQRM